MNTHYPRQFAKISSAAIALLVLSAPVAHAQPITEDLKITPTDGRAAQEFGCATAIDAGVLLVGARSDGDSGPDSGAAYLFDSSNGSQIAKLIANDGAAGDRFGFSVAIADGVVAIGAPNDVHAGIASGSVYLFDATTGVLQAKLLPSDPDEGDQFGYSVAVSGGVVAVGAIGNDDHGEASGSAYLFNASSGSQLAKLLPEEGAANQSFGVSIAMDGNTVAVGSRMYFVLGEGFTLGAVRLFDVSSGGFLRTLTAQNGTWTDFFAESIDIDEGLVAVGAWARSIFFDHSGAAYVFDAATGEQISYIFPADGHDRDNFGISVSLDDGVLAIGAHQDGDIGWVAGSAYLFDAENGSQIDKLLASDGATFDYFGTSVCIDAGVVAIGAIGDEDNGADSGSVYVFGDSDGACLADLTGDGILDLADVQAFVSGFTAQDPAADIDNSGVFDLADVRAFVLAFTTGCPA